MVANRFAALTEQGESGVNSEEYKALFASDVVYYGQFLMKPLSDKELTIRFLNEIFAYVGYPKFSKQLTDDHDKNTTLFLWEGPVEGPDNRTFTMEGSLAITEGEDGLIHKVVGYLRPLQVVALLKGTIIPSIASVLPAEYWEATRQVAAK